MKLRGLKGTEVLEPFTIHCDTCAAKLKVRNASAIGQRLSCPKCGQMVDVRAPDGWQPPVSPKDSEIESRSNDDLTDGEFGDIDSILQENQKANTGRKRSPKDVAKRVAAGEPKIRVTTGQHGKQRVTDSEPLLPDDRWVAQSSQNRRRKLMLGVGIVGVLLLASAIVLAVAAGRTGDLKETSEVDKKGNIEGNIEGSDAKDEPSTENLDLPIEQSQESPEANIPDEPVADVESTNPAQQVADSSELESEESKNDSPIDSHDAPNISANDSEGSTNESAESDRSIDNEDRSDNPSPFQPGIDDILNTGSFDAASNGASFNELANLLESAGSSLTEINQLANDPAEQRKIGLPKYYIKQPNKLDVRNLARLKDQAAGIHYKNQSLASIVAELTQITGVPISFDADELASIDFDFGTRVENFKITNASFQKALENLLTELNGQMAVRYDGSAPALITTLAAATPGIAPIQSATVDLPQLKLKTPEAFAELLQQMIEPATWGDESHNIEIRDGELLINQSGWTIRRIEHFVEAWNLTNDIRDGKTENDQLDSKSKSFLASKSKPVSFEIEHDLPIGIFLARIQQDSGVNILVDYDSLLPHGWSPNTLIPSNISEDNVGALVDELAHSMGVTTRVIDASTIELTDQESLATRTDLEFYDCSEILSGPLDESNLIELVRQNIQSSLSNDNLRIYFETELESLIVIGPQSIQRRLEAMLDRLKQLR